MQMEEHTNHSVVYLSVYNKSGGWVEVRKNEK